MIKPSGLLEVIISDNKDGYDQQGRLASILFSHVQREFIHRLFRKSCRPQNCRGAADARSVTFDVYLTASRRHGAKGSTREYAKGGGGGGGRKGEEKEEEQEEEEGWRAGGNAEVGEGGGGYGGGVGEAEGGEAVLREDETIGRWEGAVDVLQVDRGEMDAPRYDEAFNAILGKGTSAK